ncbi:MAG: LrgB family protein [Ruminococcaceae bacterium]|nr:LrgB family protein [Oscillospiraceae bacterium]
MFEAVTTTPFFGLTLSAVAWCFGCWVRKKTGSILCNPMIFAGGGIILFLALTGIPYERYAIGGDFIKMLLGPVTVLLAFNIYNHRKALGEYFVPVVIGCFVGSVTSILSILGLCWLFGIDRVLAVSMMPKSCTTAIAIGIAESKGGVGGIAAAGVVVAGLSGAIFAPVFAKIFRVKDPVAEGLAIGACSHALGTTRAMEIGQLQGAMSSIAICLCGIISSVVCMFI